jgi:hypothetical protein
MCGAKVTGGSTVKKPAKTQTSIQLASHLDRAPNSRSGGRKFASPLRRKLGALTKSGKTLGVRSFYSGDPNMITWSCQQVFLQGWPRRDHQIMSVCLAAKHSQLGTTLADSLAQRHRRQYFSTKPSPCAVPKWYWREHCKEACQDSD